MSSELLHPDRLFPADPVIRHVAREIYEDIRELPIISPHGHTEARWFAENQPFENPSALFISPDHYVFRMLYSQGTSMESLGVPPASLEVSIEHDPREVWRSFASQYRQLFRGTPSRLWIDHALSEVFGIQQPLTADNADEIYDQINISLHSPEFLPRNLFEQFNIEVLATTESAIDELKHHRTLNNSDWDGRIITTWRPDSVTNPQHPAFIHDMRWLGEITRKDTHDWREYIEALRIRRQIFSDMGATATDHGFPTPFTTVLQPDFCQELLTKALTGKISSEEAELFRGHMLTEMAQMSVEDGLVMQLHTGSHRDHNALVFSRFGLDKGCDIPTGVNFVEGLKPLLNQVGNSPDLTLIVFTLDESTYSRELAPLAGHYPALKLGPPWWFHDSPEGMLRYRQQITETAGFYNTVGFNDDTRAFLSIPARHDVARRMDSRFLATLVCEHRLTLEEAHETAHDLTYRLPKAAYKL
ncbi:glucuronate isomerase [Endozoicomonadaceae bacterium StTr2]